MLSKRPSSLDKRQGGRRDEGMEEVGEDEGGRFKIIKTVITFKLQSDYGPEKALESDLSHKMRSSNLERVH